MDHETIEIISMIIICILALIAVALAYFFYFFPSILAYRGNHPKRQVIFFLNVVTGWMGLPWVILLFWAAD